MLFRNIKVAQSTRISFYVLKIKLQESFPPFTIPSRIKIRSWVAVRLQSKCQTASPHTSDWFISLMSCTLRKMLLNQSQWTTNNRNKLWCRIENVSICEIQHVLHFPSCQQPTENLTTMISSYVMHFFNSSDRASKHSYWVPLLLSVRSTHIVFITFYSILNRKEPVQKR